MKWWCVGLLVLNLGYFAFEYDRQLAQSLAEPGAAAPLPTTAATLTLVQELPEPPALVGTPDPQAAPAPAPETSAAVPEKVEPLPQAPVAPAPEAVPSWACASIGEFASPEEADQARQRIEGADTRVHRRSEQEVTATRYWVYLDNQGSADLAKTRLAELAAKGVEDYLLQRNGEPRNAISLGLYSTKVSVEARVSALERQGFHPAVQERHRTREVYWLDIAARALARAKAAIPDAPKFIPVDCDNIALGDVQP
jgi:hypothetical protein